MSNHIGKWVSIIYRYTHTYLNKELESIGISSGTFMFMFRLYAQDGMSQDDLTKALHLDKANTTRAIRKLSSEGLVRVAVDENDKRIRRIFITEKALAIKPFIHETMNRWGDILYDGFTEEEIEQTLALNKRMAQNIMAHYEEGLLHE